MITPINGAHNVEVQPSRQQHAPKPQPQAQTPKSGALSHDQVTLKSAGQQEHDADHD
jgi:hypothetical protein